jgi:hypothetical protein
MTISPGAAPAEGSPGHMPGRPRCWWPPRWLCRRWYHPAARRRSSWWCASARREDGRPGAGPWARARATAPGSSSPPTRRGRPGGLDRARLGCGASADGPWPRPAGFVRRHGASFFICQPQPGQNPMDRPDGAVQAQPLFDLFERQIRHLRHQLLHPGPVHGLQLCLAPAIPIPRPEVPGPALLRQQLLHQPQRHSEALRHLLPGALLGFIRRHDPLP